MAIAEKGKKHKHVDSVEAEATKRAEEEYNKQKREQIYKHLMHLLSKSKFYPSYIIDKIKADDDKVKTKTKAGKPKKLVPETDENAEPAKRTQRKWRANNKYDVKDYVSSDAFQLMDHDKDGVIGKEDLRATFDSVGRLATDKELDDMVGEVPGPINFTQLLTLFAARMSGGSDEDDVVINAFSTFDVNGKIDGKRLRHALTTFGEKFTAKEVNEAFDNMYIDEKGMIDTPSLIAMLTGKGDDDDD